MEVDILWYEIIFRGRLLGMRRQASQEKASLLDEVTLDEILRTTGVDNYNHLLATKTIPKPIKTDVGFHTSVPWDFMGTTGENFQSS